MEKLKRNPNRNPRDHGGWSYSGAVWLSVLVLVLLSTGIAMHGQDAQGDVTQTEWQTQWHHFASVVHGIFAWVFCVVAGRWMWPHVVLVWSRRTSNWVWELGLVMAAASGVAALSGLALLYGAAAWREVLSTVHWWVGLAWPAIGVSHAWKWIARY